MSTVQTVSRRVILSIGSTLLLAAGPQALAVVNSIDATVTAEVVHFVNGVQDDLITSFEDLSETTENLPLTAAALYLSQQGEDKAGAVAQATFYDPRVSQVPDPDEFGIDVGAYSEQQSGSLTGLARATETREIEYLQAELNEVPGTELGVRSFFFLDGIMVIWGRPGHTDLSGTTASVELGVLQRSQTGQDGEDGQSVLHATLTLTGQADGTVALQTTGALSNRNVTLIDLSGQSDAFGPLWLVIIPATTAIAYDYQATVGTPFVLEAALQADVAAQPGTGVGVQLGIPMLETEALFQELTGTESAALLDELFGDAMGSSPPPEEPLIPEDTSTKIEVVSRPARGLPTFFPFQGCAFFGVEAMLAAGLFALLGPRRRRG